MEKRVLPKLVNSGKEWLRSIWIPIDQLSIIIAMMIR
jgi:hypothetical protein